MTVTKIIGVTPTPFDPDKREAAAAIVGSQVAGRDYVWAMVRFLPAQSVGLFVQEDVVATVTSDLYRLEENHGNGHNTHNVFAWSSLPALLRTDALLAFHENMGPFLHLPGYLRSQFSARPFPATCMVHGLSYNFLLWDVFARLLLTPTLPCDAVICTSRSARDACINLLERAK